VNWRRILVLTTIVRRVGSSVSPTPAEVARRMHVDPGWRRLDDGYATRLGPRETIGVTRQVGAWRKVDPRLPQDRWRSIGKTVGLGMWAGVVGTAWWLGSSRGRGPLSAVADLDQFGDALRLADDDAIG